MSHFDVEPGCRQSGADLHDASWVSGRNDFGPGPERGDFFNLCVEDGPCHCGPYYRVEAGTPAALMGSWKNLHSESRYRSEDIQGLPDDTLGVLKMARSIVRDVVRQGCSVTGSGFGEEFRDVLDPASQVASRLGSQEVTIVLE